MFVCTFHVPLLPTTKRSKECEKWIKLGLAQDTIKSPCSVDKPPKPADEHKRSQKLQTSKQTRRKHK